MNYPKVKEGQWIIIGKPSPFCRINNGYVFNVQTDGTLNVGYYQNQTKAIKTEVIWDGEFWQFKNSGPDGSYLRGQEEHIVKQGPPH